MPHKLCAICGDLFWARLKIVQTCNPRCRAELVGRNKVAAGSRTKFCEICGSPFVLTASQWDRVTCSRACSHVLSARKNSKHVTRVCLTCGVEFETPPCRLGKYCSKACMYARNKAATTRPCAHCGKLFSTPPSQMHVATCSTACGYAAFSGAHRRTYKGVTHIVDVGGRRIVRRTKIAAAEHNARRRRGTIVATPRWADLDRIRAFYAVSQILTIVTGVRHNVHHIVPLTSPIVCGLHVETNLDVLTAVDNIRRHNRAWPDMP